MNHLKIYLISTYYKQKFNWTEEQTAVACGLTTDQLNHYRYTTNPDTKRKVVVMDHLGIDRAEICNWLQISKQTVAYHINGKKPEYFNQYLADLGIQN